MMSGPSSHSRFDAVVRWLTPANRPRQFGRVWVFGAAFLSLLLPGAGQLATGYYRRGMLMAGLSLAVLGAGIILWRQGTTTLLTYLVQPRILIGIFIVNLLLLAFRLFSVIDVFRLGRAGAARGRRRNPLRQLVTVTALVLLLTLTTGPHAAVGYYTFITYDLLTTVFQSEASVPPTATATPQPTSTPSPTPEPTATPSPTATQTSTPENKGNTAFLPSPTPVPSPTPTLPEPTPTPTATPLPSPTPTPVPEPAPAQRISILLLGSDAGPGRSGVRTDVIMVVSVDTGTGRAAIFGIPRNMKQIPLGESVGNAFGMKTWPAMINALYSSAQRYNGLAPEGGDPGAAALKEAIGTLLGIQIDYYAMVDMAGFVGVIDALGGVTMEIPQSMQVRLSPPVQGGEWRTYSIPAGEQHLDGHTALAYVRSRTGNSDYHRMQRQRCLMGAVARQSDTLTLLLAFPDLAPIIKEIVQTDIPLDQLPELIKLREAVNLDDIVAVGFNPPDYISGWAKGGYPIPDVELIQQTVQAVFTSDVPPLETVAVQCS